MTYRQFFAIVINIVNKNKRNKYISIVEPTLIDRIPTQDELTRKGLGTPVYTHNTYEKVPYAYSIDLQDVAFGDDSLRSLLNSLNNELQWGDPNAQPKLIENAYLVARSIGDSVVASASPSALSLIDSTRTAASYNASYQDSSVEGAMGHVRTHGDGSAEYGIDIDAIGLAQIELRLREQGYEPRPMVAVLALVHTAAHEAGHMIQRGVGYTGIGSDKGVSSIDALSDTVLRNCPDARLTKNHETNVAIHNERFAEGYANATLRAAVESLGYGEDYADALVHAIALDGDVSPAMKEHLAATTEEESVKQLYEKTGQKPEYSGMLGYGKPLSLEQIVADLELVGSELIRGSDSDDMEPIQSDETLIDITNAYRRIDSKDIKKSSEEMTSYKKERTGARLMRAIGHYIRGEKRLSKK